jgi:hypothetical protein
MVEVPMEEADVLEQVKAKTGAVDAKVSGRPTNWVWSVLLAFPDGPDAYTFQTRLVDVEGPEIRFVGFDF